MDTEGKKHESVLSRLIRRARESTKYEHAFMQARSERKKRSGFSVKTDEREYGKRKEKALDYSRNLQQMKLLKQFLLINMTV